MPEPAERDPVAVAGDLIRGDKIAGDKIAGDKIEIPSVEGVGIAIGTGARVEIYGDIYYYPIKLRAPLRAHFNVLIQDRVEVFGGRDAIIRRLMEFVRDDRGGVLAITAPAGFGKTALIAYLLSATPAAFAYHFFAPVYSESSLEETFFLRNVVQQLAVWHDEKGDPPDTLADLQAVFHRLIDTPLKRTQVLVLDGLDEVTRWRLAPYLGRRLPPRMHLIVTIRDGEQDWRREYRLPRDQLHELPLDGLDRAGVEQVLHAAGGAAAQLADQATIVDGLIELAAYGERPAIGCDPFYVRFLAEDLRDGVVTPDRLASRPKGLVEYLDEWWTELRDAAGDQPTMDLFGSLAAAFGYLRRDELEALNATLVDTWAGDRFEQILVTVRRFVRGDPERGYTLAHPRLRSYVAHPSRLKVETYREKLLSYCEDWPTNRSKYSLGHYAEHLAHARRFDELSRLFDDEWISAQWFAFGSYATLANNLELAARTLLNEGPRRHVPIVALMRASVIARDTAIRIPRELLVAWARLGQMAPLLGALRGLDDVGNGDDVAVLAKLDVAFELLAGVEHVALATMLLREAIGKFPVTLLAAVRCDQIAHALRPASPIDPDQRALLRRALRQHAGELEASTTYPASSSAVDGAAILATLVRFADDGHAGEQLDVLDRAWHRSPRRATRSRPGCVSRGLDRAPDCCSGTLRTPRACRPARGRASTGGRRCCSCSTPGASPCRPTAKSPRRSPWISHASCCIRRDTIRATRSAGSSPRCACSVIGTVRST